MIRRSRRRTRRRTTITWRWRATGDFCPDFRDPRDYLAYLVADLAAVLAKPKVHP